MRSHPVIFLLGSASEQYGSLRHGSAKYDSLSPDLSIALSCQIFPRLRFEKNMNHAAVTLTSDCQITFSLDLVHREYAHFFTIRTVSTVNDAVRVWECTVAVLVATISIS